MRKIFLGTSTIVLTLAACSQQASNEGASEVSQSDFEEISDAAVKADRSSTAQEPMAETGASPILTPAPVAIPQTTIETEAPEEPTNEPQGQATMPDFTYAHEYRFEALGSDLGQIQDAHVAACDTMGPQQCRLANYRQDMDGVAGVEASLELYVASDKIRDLASQMTNIARDFGGERVEANIIGTNATRQLDQAQLQVTNNLTQKDRLEAVINDRRSTQAAKQVARDQLATLMATLSANQRQLDNVASELGFTKMDVRYASSSLFGPLLPYALIILLITAIAGFVYRSKQSKIAEPATA